MIFTSTKNNLLNVLQIVGSLVSGKSVNLPILNNILIRAKTDGVMFISTNLEIGISSPVRGKVNKQGEFTVPARTLTDFINTLPEENITFKQEHNNITITSQSQKGKIRGASTEEFPLIPHFNKESGSSVNASTFLAGLQDVSIAISQNETRPEIGGCLFLFNGKELILVGTDSFRLAEKKIRLETNTHTGLSIIVPLKTVQELIKIIVHHLKNTKEQLEIKMFISENQILFIIEKTEVISRLIEGSYPDYQQIIPTETNFKTVIKKTDFLRAVKSVSVFSETGIYDVALKGENGVLTIYSSSNQSGEGEARIEAKIEGGAFSIVLNGRYLSDGLSSISSGDVILGVVSKENPCFLKPTENNNQGSHLYIIMPIKQ